jgi:hypothetical protein
MHNEKCIAHQFFKILEIFSTNIQHRLQYIEMNMYCVCCEYTQSYGTWTNEPQIYHGLCYFCAQHLGVIHYL